MANEYNSEDTINDMLEQTSETPTESNREQNEQKVEQTEQVQESAPEPKLSRYKTLERQFLEEKDNWKKERDGFTRQFEELKRQLQPQPSQEDQLKQIQEAYQQNPMQVQMALMQKMLAESQAPLQSYIQEQQNKEFVNNSVNNLKQTYGEENYAKYEPAMNELLVNVYQNDGPDVARQLAQYPHFMYFAAKGLADHKTDLEGRQRQQQGIQQKESLAAKAKSQLQPSNSKRQEVYDSNDLISQLLGVNK